MIPAEFRYEAPRTLKQAVTLLRGCSGAKVLAGGMSLIPALKHRLVTPSMLVDIGRIDGLAGIEVQRGTVSLGTRVTHDAVTRSPDLAAHPAIVETAAAVGDVQVRNRGTVGGSVVHADPAGDWPALFLALEGAAQVVGPSGERTIPAGRFFRGMLTSALEPGEILTRITLLPERRRAGAAYRKFRQTASGFAIVGVAAQVVRDRRGRCERATLAVTGVNPMPLRIESVEQRLTGSDLDDASLAVACEDMAELEPMEDGHAGADYRRHLASVLARRALAAARDRAAG